MFDTAVYYANDDALIGALDVCDPGAEARIVHKVQPYRVTAQVERLVLPRLRGRRLDALLLHHPALFLTDSRTATFMRCWRELEDLLARGVTRRIGLSNAGRSFVEHLVRHAAVKPAVNQIECHPWNHDADLVRCCRENGLEVQCYSPLGGGRLAVKDSPAIQEAARATGRSPAQVCLRWSVQKGLLPIARARDPRHMRDNREALGFSLTSEQIDAIDRIGPRGRVWDDPIKRGCRAAVVDASRVRVPNRARFALRSGLHFAAVEVLLRRRRPAAA